MWTTQCSLGKRGVGRLGSRVVDLDGLEHGTTQAPHSHRLRGRQRGEVSRRKVTLLAWDLKFGRKIDIFPKVNR